MKLFGENGELLANNLYNKECPNSVSHTTSSEIFTPCSVNDNILRICNLCLEQIVNNKTGGLKGVE